MMVGEGGFGLIGDDTGGSTTAREQEELIRDC
jgi:hypothetical protein